MSSADPAEICPVHDAAPDRTQGSASAISFQADSFVMQNSCRGWTKPTSPPGNGGNPAKPSLPPSRMAPFTADLEVGSGASGCRHGDLGGSVAGPGAWR